MPNQIAPGKKKVVFLGDIEDEELLKLVAQRRECSLSAIYRCAVQKLLEDAKILAEADTQRAVNESKKPAKKKNASDKKN